MSSRRVFVITAALWGICLVGPAMAQGREDGAAVDVTAVKPVSARSSPLWQEYNLDLEAARSPLARKSLALLSEENLVDLLQGAEPASITTLTGRSLAEELGTNALGSTSDELVYTPVNPCRMIDTRVAGGAFAAGATRNYNLIGPSDYSSLGGNAAGCGIPGDFGGGITSSNVVRGLVLNVVAASATGLGNLQSWPTNQSPPTASIINFGTTQNIANGLAFKTCDALCIDFVFPFTCGDPCPSGDLSVKANASSVHLVVDVVGYFRGASIGTSGQSDSTGAVDMSSGTCQNLRTLSITNSSNLSRTVTCWGTANIYLAHTLGTQDNFFLNITTTSADCPTSVPGSAFKAIDNNMPTTNGQEPNTVFTVARYSLASSTTQTYYLTGLVNLGAGAGDSVQQSRLVCVMEP